MTSEHLGPLLDCGIWGGLSRGQVPAEILPLIRLGRITALRKPSGGIRGSSWEMCFVNSWPERSRNRSTPPLNRRQHHSSAPSPPEPEWCRPRHPDRDGCGSRGNSALCGRGSRLDLECFHVRAVAGRWRSSPPSRVGSDSRDHPRRGWRAGRPTDASSVRGGPTQSSGRHMRDRLFPHEHLLASDPVEIAVVAPRPDADTQGNNSGGAVGFSFIKIVMKLSLFHQNPISSDTILIRYHFHTNHFRQNPISSKTKKP